MEQTGFIFDQRLDVEFLSAIYDNDLEHAEMVFGQYLQSIPQHLESLEEAYAAGDIEAFRQQVHKVKPVFSFVGLTGITEQAASLESQCRNAGHVTELHPLFIAFKNNILEFIPVIRGEWERFKV